MTIYRFEFKAMASSSEIVVAADARNIAESVARQAVEEVSRIEKKYSRYHPDTIVSRINAAAGGDPVPYDEETGSLLGYADALYETSGGLFDITSGVLRRAWDFSKASVPDPDLLRPLLDLIGWEKVERRDNTVRLTLAGMQLDFGGFGKEYAADRAAAVLHMQGIRYGYVNLGGDIRVIGPKPGGEPWMIGIQDPRQKNRTVASIPLYTGALTTSGDYERYFVTGGRRYCHVINPRTGYPVTYWQSVTVLAQSAFTAGSRSTIAMLKEGEGLAFLEKNGLKYMAIDSLGEMYYRN